MRRLVSLGAFLAFLLLLPPPAWADGFGLPRIQRSRGRYSLIVDGAPFVMLGAQANNSSNNEQSLPQVWQTIGQLHANTLEMPVAWEQVEPLEGHFDFRFVDALLEQARAHQVRLVLLWFATWKNGGSGYAPEWVKTNVTRFPRKRDATGNHLSAPSPLGLETLNADKRAFAMLMQHLAERDRQNTVIMMQVENEPGAFGVPRDMSMQATRLFDQQVPQELTKGLNKKPGTWRAVFGKLAEQAFTSWHTARFINAVAAAGKAEKALPMYVNSALSDPLSSAGDPKWVSSGSPDWNMINVWKAAAPNIDLVAPDIYTNDWSKVSAYLDAYHRPDNALFVPEIGNDASFARFAWLAIGRGAIGFSPFGMDATGYSNYPLGAKQLDAATIEAFAAPYRLLSTSMRGWAKLSQQDLGWGFAKDSTARDQSSVMGRWKVTAQFDRWQIGDESWTFAKPDPAPSKGLPLGGGMVLQTGRDEFLVAGNDARIRFALAPAGNDAHWQYLSVDEGELDADGHWIERRRWNGDQTDYGLNLAQPVVLRVRLASLGENP